MVQQTRFLSHLNLNIFHSPCFLRVNIVQTRAFLEKLPDVQTETNKESRIRLAVHPKRRKNTFCSSVPNKRNKNAQNTAIKAPQKERSGMINNLLIGFGIEVLAETVMEKR